VLPSIRRSRLRAVQCPASDPVSFALLAGSDRAAFPEIAGWRASDCARRAASEHLECLGSLSRADSPARALVVLFSAARAALFRQSVVDHRPALPLTAAATAAALADRLPASEGSTLDAALEAHQEAELSGATPDTDVIDELHRLVVGLPPYSSAAG